MAEIPSGLHVWVGEDRARKLQRVQDLEEALKAGPLDVHHLDASDAQGPALLSLVRQAPAAGIRRLVVIDHPERLTSAVIAALVQQRDTIRHSACVVLLLDVDPPAKHPIAAMIDAAQVAEFPARDVQAVKPFALTEALGVRDVARALLLVREQLNGGRDAFDVLGMIGWQLQRWSVARRLMDAGYRNEHLAQAMGLKTAWQAQRLQTELSGRSAATIQHLLQRCWQANLDIKSGRGMPEPAVEQLVIELCAA